MPDHPATAANRSLDGQHRRSQLGAPPEPGPAPETRGVTRRQFVIGATVVAAGAVAGCGPAVVAGTDTGTADAGAPDAAALDGATRDSATRDGTTRDGAVADGASRDAGGEDSAAANRAPVWTTIPDQVWVVGVPVHLDLAQYCTDPDGDALTFALSLSLPAGLTLTGSVISGIPSAVFAATSFTATADDGRR